MSDRRDTLYHNPRCSKSREALRLLQERGVEVEVVRYLENPPSRPELRSLLDRLGLEPREILRRREKVFAELGLGNPDLGPDELVDAMSAHPILIERPIFSRGQRAILGRPPERVLELLDP